MKKESAGEVFVWYSVKRLCKVYNNKDNFISFPGLYTISKASATGIAFGAVGIIAFITALGFIVWHKHNLLGSRNRKTPGPAEKHELEHLEESPQGLPTTTIPKIIIQSTSEGSASPVTISS